MARGRMIAASVADDKRFNELPIDAALVYLMTIPQLDRDGLILGEPTVLWGQACRRRVELLQRMPAIIGAWLAAGLVIDYPTDDGDTVLHFVGFQKNQAMTHYDREAPSRFPCPPGYVRTDKGLAPDELQRDVKPTGNKVRTNSGGSPDEVPPNVKESKVIETNVMEAKGAPGAETNGYFGLHDPRPRRNAQSQQTGEATKLGVSADVFRQMTDALIDAAGWRAAVDDAGDDAKLGIAKDNAVALVRMGHTTAEQVTALATAYKAANAWRNSPPQPRDLVTYASQVKAGIAPTSKPATNANSDARLSVNDPAVQEARAKAERERQRTAALLQKLEPMKAGRIAQ